MQEHFCIKMKIDREGESFFLFQNVYSYAQSSLLYFTMHRYNLAYLNVDLHDIQIDWIHLCTNDF